MMQKQLEMCLEVMKFALEFAIVFIEAVGSVIHHANASALSANRPNYQVPVHYIGILP